MPSASGKRPPRPASGVRRSRTNVAASVSASAQESVLTEFNDLQSAVDDIESKMIADGGEEVPDDVLPTAAQEMSSGG